MHFSLTGTKLLLEVRGSVGGEQPAPTRFSSNDGTLSIFPELCTCRDCPPIEVLTIGALPPTPATWAGRVVCTVSADGVLTAYTVGGAKI
jgi:hypothetical protein